MLLKIDSFQFGEVRIEGERYTNDVIIFPNRVEANWWRREGHKLALADLDNVVAERPSKLLVGAGVHGALKVPRFLIEHLRDLGIETIVAPTKEICQLHNRLVDTNENTITTLHLTC